MSKPDDIDQDAWQTAQDICDQAALPEHYYTQGVVTALQTDIARAIMADREQCVERVEAWVTAFIKGEAKTAMFDELAAAILNRSN